MLDDIGEMPGFDAEKLIKIGNAMMTLLFHTVDGDRDEATVILGSMITTLLQEEEDADRRDREAVRFLAELARQMGFVAVRARRKRHAADR